MKIVGKQNVDYISRKTQEPVKGVSLHCVGARNDVEGEAVETIFISAKSGLFDEVAKMPIGTKIRVFYNRYGSAHYIEVEK